MPLYTCDHCRNRDELERLRANTIPGLLKRLGRAILALFHKPELKPALPRFYCVLCKEYVPEEDIVSLVPFYREVDGGAHDEGFLGFQYNVTHHGETKTHYVTIVASMLGFCHQDAFRPAHEGPAYVWEEAPEAKKRREDEAAAFETRLQGEIARANATRAEWLAKNAILSKLDELQRLVQNLDIVLPTYEKPGVMTQDSTDRVEDERVLAARDACPPPGPSSDAPGI